ncbi:MAG TPA: DUF4126 domain-containing protein [Microbacteriaceae bacterium]|nr:DUF4126 domain-containing protein [Microbacteriaceae bacterium]
MEIITGLVLATAAGLNAYIPLLGLGLLAKFSNLINLPDGWSWLTSSPMLVILVILLIIELFVDKIPLIDSLNDVLQTVIRPASGGLVFAAGIGSETVAVQDPATLFSSKAWVPIVLGVVIALIPHIIKVISRPLLNTLTGGTGAPVASTIEDAGAVFLTFFAIIAPIVALFLVALFLVFLIRRIKKARLRKERAGLFESS